MGKRKKYIQDCQVSQMKTYVLGGYPQKVLLEGKHKTAPVILYLHGGPGSPLPFCAGCRGVFPDMTDRFIMVYWDQLGCGINNYPIDDAFSIDSYVTMAIDLVEAIRNDFPENPINIFGVSWGSVLAAKVAAQRPHLIHRVLVYGQVTKDLIFNQEVFDTLDAIGLRRKEKAELDRLKKTDIPEQKDIMAMAGLIRRHTQGYQAKHGGKAPVGKILFALLTSPDYTIKDFQAVVINGMQKNQSLFQEILHVDMRHTLESITVPYFIMQGDTDIVTSTKYIASFVKNSGNPHLFFTMVPNSGHIPSGNGMKALMENGLDFFTKSLDMAK